MLKLVSGSAELEFVSVTPWVVLGVPTGWLAKLKLAVDNLTTGEPLALTVMAFEVPVISFALSVALIVWLPTVFSVAANVPVPFVNVLFVGNTASASLDVKWTVPV